MSPSKRAFEKYKPRGLFSEFYGIPCKSCTVKPRNNEPHVYNEFLGITKDILRTSNIKTYEKEPRYGQVFPGLLHSRF